MARVLGFKSCEGGVETMCVCRKEIGRNIIRKGEMDGGVLGSAQFGW